MNFDIALDQVVEFYETLTLQSLVDLNRIYADDAFFKDPFNEVSGIAAIDRIFRHMFDQVGSPRFVVSERILQGNNAFLIWDFSFGPKRSPGTTWLVRGATHLRFSEDGRVAHHRDYWDAAEELYEKLPVLGTLMRWLKRAARR